MQRFYRERPLFVTLNAGRATARMIAAPPPIASLAGDGRTISQASQRAALLLAKGGRRTRYTLPPEKRVDVVDRIDPFRF
jgi:hypothetical protein